ncbi:MAG: cell division protein ZapA [Eubacterium sp.]|nr:cell division protein ZapA [Eubacterium sp.]
MPNKNAVKVMIDGKLITLGGYESEEYLQKVANYLNHKIRELTESGGYRRLSPELKNLLLQLNIADDYFKAKQQAESLESDMETQNSDAYDIKQELVAAQIELKKLQAENEELKRKITG